MAKALQPPQRNRVKPLSRSARFVLAAAACVFASLLPARALACAACACGNPVLTSMGTEPPLANRVRLATSLRAWTLDEGVRGVDGSTIRELRMDLLASYAPT
jgi:hypothetical protein